ncbi:hypothetical protein B0H17DRAFT_1216368 [Mycena rosella]|uniref:Uncharacterized protein n=1 Tax=Mycena rosella TaxID=1033263 RepID=A0AAD7FWD8_MYCRO|nr:hypothetical protein B0H17DRAFT_1216368 [Mycena rosella]
MNPLAFDFASRPLDINVGVSASHSPVRVPSPLPRITDPYHWMYDSLLYPAELVRQESGRIASNAEVCRLLKLHVKAKRANAKNIPNRDLREREGWDTQLLYEREKSAYEDEYGKFVPDAENAAWFARKAPRVVLLKAARAAAVELNNHDDPLMAAYLALAQEFEADFGHAFSSQDGWDEHFKQMAFHASTAEALAARFDNDVEQIAAAASQPVKFTVYNPYGPDDTNYLRFNNEMRRHALTLDPAATSPPSEGKEIVFLIANCFADCPERRLRQHYKCAYIKYLLQRTAWDHSNDLNDTIQESRGANSASPFTGLRLLWETRYGEYDD